MVFTPSIFVSFLVMIKQCLSIGRETDVFHRHGREHDRTTARCADFIHLWELSRSKLHVIGCWKNVGLEQNMVVVFKSQWCFVTGMRSQSGRNTTFFIYDVDIHTSQTVTGKGDLLAVRTPNRASVVCRIGCYLISASTIHSHGINIAFVRKCDLLSVGRDCRITHPCCIVFSMCV